MATVQEELQQSRDSFEDLKGAVSARLDSLNAQIQALRDQLGNQELDADAQAKFDALQADSAALAEQLRATAPGDGGGVIEPPADTGGTGDGGTDAAGTDAPLNDVGRSLNR